MSRASTNEQAIGQLAEQFPAWHIWAARRGDGTPGDLMATRRRNLTTAELDAGLARTLPMGYGTDLRAQLAEQAEREDAMGGRP